MSEKQPLITGIPSEEELAERYSSGEGTGEHDIVQKLFDVTEAGLPQEVLDEHKLSVFEASEEPFSMAVSELEPIEEHNNLALLSLIDLGGQPLKIYGYRGTSGKIYDHTVLITHSSFDAKDLSSDRTQEAPRLALTSELPEVETGRAASEYYLGLDDLRVSRRHAAISLHDGVLNVSDLESTNGTNVITGRSEAVDDVTEEALGHEALIESTNFSFIGAFPAGSRYEAYAFESTNEQGERREFFVYQSNSEGSWRVAGGIEPNGRFIKGPELQYTQDTQLHPDFEKLFNTVRDSSQAHEMFDAHHVMKSFDEVDSVNKDFEEQINIHSWPTQDLEAELRRTTAGALSTDLLAADLGVSAGETPQAFIEHVDRLNTVLEESGVIPDFSNPTSIDVTSHPSLGSVTREVFTAPLNGRDVEWHMASDSQGRVWIDRVRIADSKPTDWGTDAEMLYSGILTSKPIEYEPQTSGLPQEVVGERINGHYKDISKMQDMFLPVQKYREQRNLIRQ